MMKKIISTVFLFCISANAVDTKAPLGKFYPHDDAEITKHPIKNWKKYGSTISIWENQLRACAKGKKEEQFTKLNEFIQLCFAEKINPHWFCNREGEISALELACQLDFEGNLVHQLMDSKFSNNTENIAISFEAAYVAENDIVVDNFKTMALNGLLLPEELSALASRKQIPFNERLFFLSCFTNNIHNYFKQSALEQYIIFLEPAIQLDPSGEIFNKLISHIKSFNDHPLNSDVVSRLFYVAQEFYNTAVLDSLQKMIASNFISPYGLIKAMLLTTKATTIHFFLHSFNANLEFNLKQLSSRQYLEILKIACKVDKNGRDFKKLIKHKNKLSSTSHTKAIITLLNQAISTENYTSLKTMLAEGLLSLKHLRDFMPCEIFLTKKLALLNYLTESLCEYNGTNFYDYRAIILKLACEIDQNGEAFAELITIGKKPEQKLREELFEIACAYKNSKVIEIMQSKNLLSDTQIKFFENIK